MRLLVTGSRSVLSWRPVYQCLWGWYHLIGSIGNPGDQLIIVHGAAVEGVDKFASEWVDLMRANGQTNIDQEPYPADWDGPCAPWETGLCQPGHRRPSRFVASADYCPTAGHRRNQTMVDSRPDYFVAMTDRPIEKSKGTFDCFKRARAAHISGEKIELL